MSPTHSRHLTSLPRGPLCGRMPRASSPVPLDVSPASDAVYLVSLQTLPLISQAPSWFRWPVPPPALGLLGSNHSRCPFPESQGSGRVPTLPPAFIPLPSSRRIYVPPTGYLYFPGARTPNSKGPTKVIFLPFLLSLLLSQSFLGGLHRPPATVCNLGVIPDFSITSPTHSVSRAC